MAPRRTKEEGLAATNRDYVDYDQVEKRQSYHLTEDEQAEEFDTDFPIRTCQLGRFLHGGEADRRAFAEELGSALEEIGFAILTGHGVDPAVHAACEREVERVFTAPTLAEKLRFAAERHGAVNQGYFPLEETTDIHPDQVEGWVFGRRAFDLGQGGVRPEDFWPDPTAEKTFRELFLAQEPLILPIMQSVLLYLGCDPHLYDSRLTPPAFAIRLNHYPPVAQGSRAGRLLGHEDVDLFTLLPAPRGEGLQVLNRRNMKWIRLDAPPGSIVLNTGDYMQRITNDRLPSTTHRVSQPRDAAERGRTRVSFPMNVYLREDEWLEVLPGLGEPKYAPIRVLEFHTQTTAKYYGDDYAVT